MSVTATEFRKNLFQLLSNVVETGEPLKINIKNHSVIVSPETPSTKLSRLTPHQLFTGNPEEITELDWSEEWQEEHI